MAKHPGSLNAARDQLVSDCQAQLYSLAFAVNTLVEALPDDPESRLLTEAFAATAAGVMDNLQTALAVAIDVAGVAAQLDVAPETLAPGDVLRIALAAEISLAIGTATGTDGKTSEAEAADTDAHIASLIDEAKQLGEQLADALTGRREASVAAGKLGLQIDQLCDAVSEQTGGNEAAFRELEMQAKSFPDAIVAGGNQLRKGLSAWREAQQLNSE